MKIRTFAAISFLLLTFSFQASAQSSMIPTASGMTNQQAWDALSAIDAGGNTMFGKCKVLNATTCASCACDYYFRANILGSLNMLGWPKNPSSGDSTGCLGSGCWGGYTPPMCTSDVKGNAKAILLDALAKNACGTPIPPDISGGVSVTESSNFFFVNPNESCAQGKIKCGAINIGSSIGGVTQFTIMPERVCRAAFGYAKKKKNSTARMITCAQLQQNNLSNSEIQNAASMLSSLNASYNIFEMAGLQKYLGYSSAQLLAMPTEEVALYYVAVGKNSLVLPEDLKSRVKPDKFNETRAAGDNWIIQAEITAAETQLATISQGVVTGKNFTLSEALAFIKSSAGN